MTFSKNPVELQCSRMESSALTHPNRASDKGATNEGIVQKRPQNSI